MVYVDDLDAPPLDADDAHHLTRVLRLRPGEPVVAGDGRGRLARCAATGGPGRRTRAATVLEVDGAVAVVPGRRTRR